MQLIGSDLELFGTVQTPLDPGDSILITVPQQMGVIKGPKTCTFNDPKGLLITNCTGISDKNIVLTLGEALPGYF